MALGHTRRRSVRRAVAALVAVTAPLLSGCFAYFNDLQPLPPEGASARVSDESVQLTVAAIGRELSKLGMGVSPALGYDMEMSRTSREDPTLTVGKFVPLDDAFDGRNITVYCQVGKQRGDFSVRIVDLDWFAETDLTRSVHEATRSALETQFPGWEIAEKRWRSPRILGP
jgi:hypothetical protein